MYSLEVLRERVAKAILDYNELNKRKIDIGNQYFLGIKINTIIVLFEDALAMLCKINRIISQMFGHALLIGLVSITGQGGYKFFFIIKINLFNGNKIFFFVTRAVPAVIHSHASLVLCKICAAMR